VIEHVQCEIAVPFKLGMSMKGLDTLCEVLCLLFIWVWIAESVALQGLLDCQDFMSV
jgi:hypothetical protein